MTQTAPLTVGFVLYQGCTLLDFAGATQVFAQWASGGHAVWLAPTLDPITTSEGFSGSNDQSSRLQVIPSHSFDDHPPLDIVFVPGGGGDAVQATMADARYLDFLRRVAAEGNADTWVGAVCVGTFIVAAAGLLKNASVTTHWRLQDALKRLQGSYVKQAVPGYPRAVVDRDARRFTGGGVSASIDLALELLRDREGAHSANYAALVIQYEPELPDCVLPGSPGTSDPAIVAEATRATTAGLAAPIERGVAGLLA